MTFSQWTLNRLGFAVDGRGVWWNDERGSTHLFPLKGLGWVPYAMVAAMVIWCASIVWLFTHAAKVRAFMSAVVYLVCEGVPLWH